MHLVLEEQTMLGVAPSDSIQALSFCYWVNARDFKLLMPEVMQIEDNFKDNWQAVNDYV